MLSLGKKTGYSKVAIKKKKPKNQRERLKIYNKIRTIDHSLSRVVWPETGDM